MSFLVPATAFLAAAMLAAGDSAEQIIIIGEALEAVPIQPVQQELEAGRIEARGAISLSEALDLASSANVTTNSRGETLVYLRNAGERQLAVLFDGAALNMPWDNRLSLDLVPTQALGGIIVTPGTLSLRYGVNSAGGAIELIPATAGSLGPRREVSALTGSGGLRSVSGLWLSGDGPVQMTAAAERTERDGLTRPEGGGLQDNTDLERDSILLRAAWEGDGAGQLSVGLMHVDSAFGIAPARFDRPSQGRARYWRYPENSQTLLVVRGARPVGRFDVESSVWRQQANQTIASYDSARYDRLEDTQHGRDRTTGLRLQSAAGLWGGTLRLSLNALGSRHDETATRFDAAGQPGVPDRSRFFDLRTSYAAEFSGRAGAFGYVFGVGRDRLAPDETGGRPPADTFAASNALLGVSWQANDPWRFRASVSRKHRMPTLRELYGAALNRFLPNPDLSPETVNVAELSARYTGERLSFEVTPFYNRVEDTLDQRNVTVNGQGLRQRINLAGSEILGVELRGEAILTDRLRLDGHVLASEARRLREPGGPAELYLSERPELIGRIALTWESLDGLGATAEIDHRGRAWSLTDEDVFEPLARSTALNLGVSWAPEAAGWRAFIRAKNVTDTEIEPQFGLPAPGREIRAGIRLQFG
jgi:iron complex outermembrane recepter protein